MEDKSRPSEVETTISAQRSKAKRALKKGLEDPEKIEEQIKCLREEVCQLQKGLEDAKTALDAKNKDYLYVSADFDNYRRGMEKRMTEFREVAMENALRGVVDVSENLERLREHAAKEGDIGKLREGIDRVFNHMTAFLASSGVQEMNAVGERFDPMRHEALMEETSTKCEDGTVVRVLQKGYMLNGKVMRAAKVCVARKVEPKPEPQKDEEKENQKSIGEAKIDAQSCEKKNGNEVKGNG